MGRNVSRHDGFFVYLGPNVRGVVQNGAIYEGSRNEVEAFLFSAIERFPQIRIMLISSETLAEDRIKIKTPGNYLYEEYRKFVAELKKKEV